jgi:hypothetical protein
VPDKHPQGGASMRRGDAVSPRNNTGRVLACVEGAFLCCVKLVDTASGALVEERFVLCSFAPPSSLEL